MGLPFPNFKLLERQQIFAKSNQIFKFYLHPTSWFKRRPRRRERRWQPPLWQLRNPKLRELRTLSSLPDLVTLKSDSTFNLSVILADLLNGPNISVCKGKRLSSKPA